MALKVPKYRENESCFDLEEMLAPLKSRVRGTFHTRQKPNYSPLKKTMEKDKIKNN